MTTLLIMSRVHSNTASNISGTSFVMWSCDIVLATLFNSTVVNTVNYIHNVNI